MSELDPIREADEVDTFEQLQDVEPTPDPDLEVPDPAVPDLDVPWEVDEADALEQSLEAVDVDDDYAREEEAVAYDEEPDEADEEI